MFIRKNTLTVVLTLIFSTLLTVASCAQDSNTNVNEKIELLNKKIEAWSTAINQADEITKDIIEDLRNKVDRLDDAEKFSNQNIETMHSLIAEMGEGSDAANLIEQLIQSLRQYIDDTSANEKLKKYNTVFRNELRKWNDIDKKRVVAVYDALTVLKYLESEKKQLFYATQLGDYDAFIASLRTSTTVLRELLKCAQGLFYVLTLYYDGP